PEQAIWLPCNCLHSVFSEYGANLKSLYIEQSYQGVTSEKATILHITPLTRELILAAADFDIEYPLQGYENDLVQLLLQSLAQLKREDRYLPWPVTADLNALCHQLYEQPDNTETTALLAEKLAVSPRTLDRRFRRETGLPLKQWRLKLRLLQAIQLLNTGQSITTIALELGYSSPSPFIFMFREQLGISPAQYRKLNLTGR
ncbi:MAG: AraC-like DNA-binding protein, partial [Motiliproteus sp.]